MTSDRFTGQLVEHSVHGDEFCYGPGGYGAGAVFNSNGDKIGQFLRKDAGDGSEPLGIYVRAIQDGDDADYIYADNINGASAYLVGRNAK
ncbi:hypothetical protein [Streptomyces sp. 039-1]|uniref:hypothetical protein n=1 Tax=Streptomyces sp. 039-1 TaxID=2789263 RepID=UPI0039F55C52